MKPCSTVRLAVALFLTFASLAPVCAQTLHSGYFINTMPVRHKLNPAFAPDRNYVSIPALGNVSASVNSNFSATALFYRLNNDELTTFMHPDISSAEFMSKIGEGNLTNLDVNVTALSSGFYSWGGFNTAEINLRSFSHVNIPGEFFRFMKDASEANILGGSYSIRDMLINTTNYAELALGHSRPVGERWTLGGKLKFLTGVAGMRVAIDQLDISSEGTEWRIHADGTFDIASRNARFGDSDDNGKITDMQFGRLGLSGFGMGIDLGAAFQATPNLTLSMSVLDLGFIKWGNNLRAQTMNNEFSFDGFDHIAIDENGEYVPLGDQFNQIVEDFKDLTHFQESSSSRSELLKATLNFGAEYSILDRKISFGLLSSTRFGYHKVLTEVVGSANFRPAPWFSAALTGTASNYGMSWGWMINFAPKGFNFFMGFDHMVTRLDRWLPRGNASLVYSMGMSVTFGPRRDASFRVVD